MEATEQNGLQFEISATGTEAVDSFRKIANALNRMKKASEGNGLSKVNFELKALSQTLNKTNTAEPFHKLASALTRINKNASGDGLREATIGLRVLSDTVNQINTKKMAQLANALHQLAKVRGIKASARAAAKAADAVQNTDLEEKTTSRAREKDYQQEESQGTASAAQLAKSSIFTSKLWTKGVEVVNAIGAKASNAISIASNAFMRFRPIATSVLKSVGSHVASFGKTMLSVFGKTAALPLTAIHTFAEEVEGIFDRLKKIGSKFLTVILYRLIRTAIMALQQGVKEGLQHLYLWSDALGGQFAKSMDSLTTSFQYLKNSIAAMASPIINALAPAIDFLIDKLVDLLNLVNQFIARLTGAKTWTKAKKAAASYGDTISDANKKAGNSAKKAAKDFKAYLLGFDEINKPDKDSSSGSGGSGSGSGGTDTSGMFEVAEFDDSISNFADEIKKKIEEGDWYGAGELLGEKLNSIIDAVDWEAFGRKIGEKIDHAIQLVGGFLHTVNFEKIGEAIGNFLSGAISEIDFHTLGYDIIAHGLTMWGDMLIGLINGLDFGELGKAFGDLFRGVFEGIGDFFQKYDWSDEIQKLFNGIITFVKNAKLDEMITAFCNMMGDILLGAGDAMENGGAADFVFNLIDEIKKGFENADKSKLAEGIKSFVHGAFFLAGQLLGESAERIAIAIANGIGDWFDNDDKDETSMATKIKNFIKTNIWGAFKSGIKKQFTKEKVDDAFAKMFEKVGTWLGEFIAQGLSDFLMNPVGFQFDLVGFLSKVISVVQNPITFLLGLIFGKNKGQGAGSNGGGNGESTKEADGFVETHIWTPIKESLKKKFTESNVAKLWSGMVTGAGTAWDNIKKTVRTKAENIWTEISTPFKNLGSDIQEKWDEIKESASKAWESLKNGIKTTVSNIWGSITGAFNTLKTNVSNVWENIKTTASTKWTELKTKISNVVGSLWGAITGALTTLKNNIQSVWESIKNTASEKWNALKTGVSNIVGGIWGAITGAFNTLKNNVQYVWQTIQNKAGEIWVNMRSGIAGIVNGIWGAISGTLETLKSKVNEIWSSISGGASNAWTSIGNFFRNGINTVIGFINSFIDVINNLLGKLGSSKRLGKIGTIGNVSSNYNYKASQADRLAGGTPPVGSPTTAVVNDQRGPTYREAIVRSNGNVEIPKGRNVLTNLNKGDAVVPAKQTKELFPHYANGVGDWLTNLANNLKGGGNIGNAISTMLGNVGRDTGSGLFNAMWDAIKGIVKGSNLANIIKEHILDMFSSKLKVRQPLSFWRPYVIKSLEMNGLPTSAAYVNAWLSQINSESGGNPAAINLWDSNAKAGIPSKGLLQTIDPTFNAYHFKGYNDIWNGFHNMLAAMNYAKNKYGYSGMLRVIGHNHGYAKGGFPTEGELFMANENGIEMMGKMGNRNVVANNEQIVDAVAIGVANAVASVMDRYQGQTGDPVIDFTLVASNERLYRMVKQGKRDYEGRYHVVEEF